jgi:hypothetical protein
VKIYVAVVEALGKGDRQDETQFTTKIDNFLSFIPQLNANVLFFLQVFFEFHAMYDQTTTQGSGACVFLTLRITLLCTHFLAERNHQSFKACCSKVEPHPCLPNIFGHVLYFTFHLDWLL